MTTGREVYAFGEWTLDVGERRLASGSRIAAIAPKAHDVLVYLVRQAGRLVTKAELLERVWAGAFVEEGILAVHVSALRKALGDTTPSRFIETVPRAGYRFIGRVEAPPALPRPPAAADVYELVGRGRAGWLTASFARLPQALADYQAAVALDPTFAPAHAGLARAYCAQAELRQAPPAEAYAKASAAALCALAMDPECADAHVALGTVLFLSEWNWTGAERSLARALDLDPNDTAAYLMYGRVLEAQGRLDEGLAMKRRALEREPHSPLVHLAIAMSYWHQRRYDESMAWAERTLALDPKHLLAHEFIAGAFWAMGDFDRHMAVNVRHAELAGVPAAALEALQRSYDEGGRAGVVRAALDHARVAGATLPEMQLALFHGELGELDQAIGHLHRAIDGRDPCLVDLAIAPQWDALRRHARFGECLARLKLDQAAGRDVLLPGRIP
jgi:DNA-binding winged helix-turn-helix (wHTH) protein/Flp pilus assembly protein TadD